MKIKRFATSNWMGAPDGEYRPGALTIISGENGSGKSSIITALQYAIGSGHDPSVIRVGTDAARVTIETDDGTMLRVRVTPKNTTRDITDIQGRKITRSAEFIRSLVNGLSLDPVALLAMSPKQQMDAIIAAAPLRVTATELAFVPVKALDGISLDRHALEVLEQIRKRIYDERTGLARVAKDKETTAAEMERTLPEDAPEGNWSDALKRATNEFKELQRGTQARIAGIKEDAHKAEDVHHKLFQAQKDSIKEEMDIAIQKIRDDSYIAIKRYESMRDHTLAQISHDREGELKAAEGDYQPKHQELSGQIARAKAMAEQHAKTEQTREFIATQKAQAMEAGAGAQSLTAVIDRIETLKKSLASSLPVPGLAITENGLTLDGIPFQRVNKAKQIQVALSLARLQAGELGLIIIDDAEHMDSKSFAAFREAAEASGLQFIAAKVTDGTLEIEGELKVLPGQLVVEKVISSCAPVLNPEARLSRLRNMKESF